MGRARDVYERLLDHYGPQHWWPAETAFEAIVGALLMQQTSWQNVEVAIGNLRRAGLLDIRALAEAPIPVIRRHVRIAGLYRTKPARLRAFCRHLLDRSGGDLARYFARPTDVVRADLLDQNGVGPETADSILLYAGGHPIFVVDAYTERIGGRIGLFRTGEYRAIQRTFEQHVPRDLTTYQEYHALLVRHAKTLWRQAKPYAEVPRILDALDGVPRAVVSNADHEFLLDILERNALRFDAVITSESAQTYKPRPRIFEAALESLRVRPNDVIHVGDSLVADVEGASRLGMRTVWVNRTALRRGPADPAPDAEARDLNELPAIVERLSRDR